MSLKTALHGAIREAAFMGGRYTGEDTPSFDVTLAKVDQRRNQAVVVVRLVPPTKLQINLPADWMKSPVKDSQNNGWRFRLARPARPERQGRRRPYVRILVELTTGRILSATEENVVDVLERECSDPSLANPGPAVTYRINRRVEIRAE